jgi:transketolase
MSIIDPAPTITFGKALTEAAKKDNTIVALAADVGKSTGLWEFKEVFPDRFFDVGVAEQNMVGISAGMADSGLTPFVSTFGCFASMRACEQVRTDICYPNQNVKIVGTHTGISFGPGGTTHHVTEDIAIMRSFANMTVIVPADSIETAKVIEATAKYKGPCYIRLPRGTRPYLYESYDKCSFKIGKADILRQGQDITIIACGMTVDESVKAADILGKESIDTRVINMNTVKPIDKEVIINAAKETQAIVTVEEHNIMGGLGSAVSEVVVQNFPVPIKIIGIPDIYSTIGPSSDLYELYGLDSKGIVKSVKEMMASRK